MNQIYISIILVVTLIGGSYAVTCDSFDTEKSCTGRVTDVGACIWDAEAGTCAADGQGVPDGMVGVTSVEIENTDQAMKPISLAPGPDTPDRLAEILPTNDTFCSQPPMQDNFMGIQCAGYFPSWVYNKTTDACEEYVYGGCGATMNLFSTEQACTTSANKFCRPDNVTEVNGGGDPEPTRTIVVDDVQDGLEKASRAYPVTVFSGLFCVIGALALV